MNIGDIKIDGNKKWELCPCHRCGGSGIYSTFHGICFRCDGVGFDSSKDWRRVDEQAVKRREAYAKKKQEEVEKKRLEALSKIDAVWKELKEKSPEVYEVSKEIMDRHNLVSEYTVYSFFERFIIFDFVRHMEMYKNLPDWAIENAENRLAKEKEEKEKRERSFDVPNEGKIEICGEVITTKWKDNGFGGGNIKALIIDDRGFKVWGTLSEKFFQLVDDEDCTGKRFKFYATVSPSENDSKFGFYKRPSKVKLA